MGASPLSYVWSSEMMELAVLVLLTPLGFGFFVLLAEVVEWWADRRDERSHDRHANECMRNLRRRGR